MDDIIIKQVNSLSPEYEQVWQLREAILRKPIGLSLKDEDLSDDEVDIIIVAIKENKVIGCLMLHEKDDEEIKFRQMAVYPEWQGKGVGAKLMKTAEYISAILGFSKIVLHARVTAKDFYSGLGYTITSGVFTEVGIDHVKMKKALNP